MLTRVILFLLLPTFILAQSRIDIEADINNIIEQGDASLNSDYYDLLLYYYENPIDLNKAENSVFALLNLLTQEQIDQIIQHREVNGPLKSIYELQSISSLSIDEIKRIRPFVIVTQKNSLVDSFKGLARLSNSYTAISYSRLVQQLQGTKDAVFLGSPDKAQFRLRLKNPGKLNIGLASQKDPGEPWLHNRGIVRPDHITGHLFLENHGKLRRFVLGDYRLQFGQGLVLGSGFMSGKNVETVTSVKQATVGIMPYSSVQEANYFRGIATSIALFNELEFTTFYSNQFLDATVDADNENIVSSIRTSGLHRTASEIKAMDQLHEQVIGIAFNYNRDRFSSGFLLTHTMYNKQITPQQRSYNFYKFKGSQLTNFSWFGEYRLNNFTWFGELAKSVNAGWGINSGLLGQVSKYVGLSLSIRALDKDFHSLYGQSFTERSSIGNENGIYWGLKINPIRDLTISAYYDIYKFPWLISSTASPAIGNDLMARIEYKFDKQSSVFLQARKEVVEASESNIPVNLNTDNSILKTIFNFDYATSSTLSFRSRFQYNLANSIEKGFLLLQDVNYNTINFGFSGRFLLFDTESFASRQYVYEKDMLYTFNTRAYSGRGFSYYLILKYKPFRSLSIRAKVSYTEYLGVAGIGSGTSFILGNARTQFTAQLHYRF